MNHDIEHSLECDKLMEFSGVARLSRPATGKNPLEWAQHEHDGEALGLNLALAHDGMSCKVRVTQPLSSLNVLRGEIRLIRAAAVEAETADTENYEAAAVATAEMLENYARRGATATVLPIPVPVCESHDNSVRTQLRRREDYRGVLPREFASYETSASKAFRGSWAWGKIDKSN